MESECNLAESSKEGCFANDVDEMALEQVFSK
jgi:hypothetical protein